MNDPCILIPLSSTLLLLWMIMDSGGFLKEDRKVKFMFYCRVALLFFVSWICWLIVRIIK